MTELDLTEANLIIEALSYFEAELGSISSAGDRFAGSRSPDVEVYRRRLVDVKASLKAAAKTGVLDSRTRSQTELERCFFGPAVQHASAHFRLRTDSPPAKWTSGLYDPIGDISYYLHALRKHISSASLAK